jgi:hypothetical protein
MLIPDNVHPEDSIYYNGSFVLQTIQQYHVMDLLELYLDTKLKREMSMPVFVLCLDWLFLIDQITLNEQGKVQLCS